MEIAYRMEISGQRGGGQRGELPLDGGAGKLKGAARAKVSPACAPGFKIQRERRRLAPSRVLWGMQGTWARGCGVVGSKTSPPSRWHPGLGPPWAGSRAAVPYSQYWGARGAAGPRSLSSRSFCRSGKQSPHRCVTSTGPPCSSSRGHSHCSSRTHPKHSKNGACHAPSPNPGPQQPTSPCPSPHVFGADQSPVTPPSPRALTVFFSILAAYGAPVPFSSQLYTTEVAPLAGQRVCEAAWVQQGPGGPTCPPAMSQNPVLCQRRELSSLPPASIPAFPVKPF